VLGIYLGALLRAFRGTIWLHEESREALGDLLNVVIDEEGFRPATLLRCENVKGPMLLACEDLKKSGFGGEHTDSNHLLT